MRPLMFVGLAVLMAVGAAWVEACCMAPLGYDGDVDQRAQQVAILHHDGHQELVVRVAPYFKGAEELPGYLAWVLTVPSKPTGYAVGSSEVFADAFNLSGRLQKLANDQEAARSKFELATVWNSLGSDMAPAANRAAGGLSVSESVRVGPYEITEVKARGLDAMDALNQYLEERAFPQEDPAHMRWFIENDFTFLCIYIRPPEGEDKLGAMLELEPLQVGFDTPRPYYPGMFSSQQGNFKLRLATITSRPLSRASLGSVRRKLMARNGEYDNLWTVKQLPEALGAAAAKASSFSGVDRWHVNTLRSRGFNSPGAPRIADWTEDVLFALGGAADEPPGWYYGDREIGGMERFWREHRYAALSVAFVPLVLLLVFLVFRMLRKRRLAGARGARS